MLEGNLPFVRIGTAVDVLCNELGKTEVLTESIAGISKVQEAARRGYNNIWTAC